MYTGWQIFPSLHVSKHCRHIWANSIKQWCLNRKDWLRFSKKCNQVSDFVPWLRPDAEEKREVRAEAVLNVGPGGERAAPPAPYRPEDDMTTQRQHIQYGTVRSPFKTDARIYMKSFSLCAYNLKENQVYFYSNVFFFFLLSVFLFGFFDWLGLFSLFLFFFITSVLSCVALNTEVWQINWIELNVHKAIHSASQKQGIILETLRN